MVPNGARSDRTFNIVNISIMVILDHLNRVSILLFYYQFFK